MFLLVISRSVRILAILVRKFGISVRIMTISVRKTAISVVIVIVKEDLAFSKVC
ncbi:hypothetical protein [Paenisporosarcina quisquiliarum]|uniref:hypothetical protein n=1 Tax=Paenisporosarcina quisquiliarum TaxID=365346 RepID=UPI003735B3AE